MKSGTGKTEYRVALLGSLVAGAVLTGILAYLALKLFDANPYLSRLKAMVLKKPYIVRAYTQNVPDLTIHESLSNEAAKAKLDSLSTLLGIPDSTFKLSEYSLTVSPDDSAFVDSVFSGSLARSLAWSHNLMFGFDRIDYRNSSLVPVYVVDNRVAISGKDIVRVEVIEDFGSTMIQGVKFGFRFNGAATDAFSKVTEKSVGNYLAIVMNGRVDCMPLVMMKITTGYFEVHWRDCGPENLYDAWERFRKARNAE